MTDKEAYFKKSAERGVANRCPILHRCRRRSNTIALFNDMSVEGGINWAELQEPYISIKGEAPYMIGGNTSWLYGALCPEVPLFEPSVAGVEFTGSPITKGQYDKYTNPKFQILEKGHYSECAEYSEFQVFNEKQSFVNVSPNNCKEVKVGSGLAHWQWIIGILIAVIGIIVGYIK